MSVVGYNRSHADHSKIIDGAVMDHTPMPKGNIISYYCLLSGAGMDHYVLLDGHPVPDNDGWA